MVFTDVIACFVCCFHDEFNGDALAIKVAVLLTLLRANFVRAIFFTDPCVSLFVRANERSRRQSFDAVADCRRFAVNGSREQWFARAMLWLLRVSLSRCKVTFSLQMNTS